jgi:uncharacterized protein YndB with AHSA1/START domain
MSHGVLVTEGGRPAVRLERHLADPPAVVWRAITEREELRSWFPCEVVVDGGLWAVGASISFSFPPELIDMTLTGTVLVVEEPRLLSYSWGDEVLRFQLSEEDGGTRLVLINELPPGNAARNAAGWDECLDRLAGFGPVENAWRRRFDAYASVFEPIIGVQEGPPPGYKGGD